MSIRDWFPPYYSGSHAKVCGYAIYGLNKPLPKWVKIIFKIQGYINRVYYWFYSRLVLKKNVVKLPTTPSWHDTDYLIFLACFELLARYVEEELGPEDPEWAASYKGYRVHSQDEEAIDLYLWYKEKRDKNFEDYSWSNYDAYHKKLKRLIEISPGLWT